MKSVKKLLKKLKPHKDAAKYKKIAFWAFVAIIGMGLAGLIGLVALFVTFGAGLPDIEDIDNLFAAQSTEIFDRDGNLLYTIHGEENRERVPYEEISKEMRDAIVAIEDDMFWEHKGFDILAIGKAVIHEVTGLGQQRGGSTITQQYIKNTFLTNERTYTRKVKELILATRLEKQYSKEEILGLYLNRVPFGNNAYGVQKAAEVYFNKNASELDLAESVILAALPNAPSRYNPYGNNKYSHLLKEFTAEELESREITEEHHLELEEYSRGLIGSYVTVGDNDVYIAGRTDIVLKRMYDIGNITKDERQKALDEIQTLEFKKPSTKIKHPHFVLYIREQLENEYGKELLEQGGLKIYTTLDSDLQEHAETVIAENAASNLTRFDANNMASLTINPKNGHILSMVGSADYFNEDIDGNVNVTVRPVQPGSSFKPFVFAQAFYNGYAPGNVIYDVPTTIGNRQPQNYEGGFRGRMSVRDSLGQSRNIPAIKAFYLAEGQKPIIELVEKMGITTLDPDTNYSYPLALGAVEVPMTQMVTAYSVFANNGKKPELTGILKIENAEGEILEEWEGNEETFEEVMDPQVAYMINSILSDRDAGVGPGLYVSGYKNAAKTGTSTKTTKLGGGSVQPSDAWTIGYTPERVTAVWVGNTDGRGLNYSANGYDSAAPTFKSILAKAVEDTEITDFPVPDGIKSFQISKASGKLPGENTPEEMLTEDVFPDFAYPEEVEEVFFTVEVDKISGLLPNEFTPETCIEERQFQNFEPIADLQNWKQEIEDYYKGLAEQARKKIANGEDPEAVTSELLTSDEGIVIGAPPTEFDDAHTEETFAKKPIVNILSPRAQSEVQTGLVPVEIELIAENGVELVEYFLDEQPRYQTSTAPYSTELMFNRLLEPGSKHLIVVKVTDNLCYTSQSAIEVRVAEDNSPSFEDSNSEDQNNSNSNSNQGNNSSNSGNQNSNGGTNQTSNTETSTTDTSTPTESAPEETVPPTTESDPVPETTSPPEEETPVESSPEVLSSTT